MIIPLVDIVQLQQHGKVPGLFYCLCQQLFWQFLKYGGIPELRDLAFQHSIPANE
jgi:hypothetical protein